MQVLRILARDCGAYQEPVMRIGETRITLRVKSFVRPAHAIRAAGENGNPDNRQPWACHAVCEPTAGRLALLRFARRLLEYLQLRVEAVDRKLQRSNDTDSAASVGSVSISLEHLVGRVKQSATRPNAWDAESGVLTHARRTPNRPTNSSKTARRQPRPFSALSHYKTSE